VEKKERGKEMKDGGSSSKRNPSCMPLVATVRTLSLHHYSDFRTQAVYSNEIPSLIDSRCRDVTHEKIILACMATDSTALARTSVFCHVLVGLTN